MKARHLRTGNWQGNKMKPFLWIFWTPAGKERGFSYTFSNKKNTLFGGIWPSPHWWAEAQEAQSVSALQRVPSPGTHTKGYPQRVHALPSHPAAAAPRGSTNDPSTVNQPHPTYYKQRYFREVTVLAPKERKALTVWCEAQTQVQVTTG